MHLNFTLEKLQTLVVSCVGRGQISPSHAYGKTVSAGTCVHHTAVLLYSFERVAVHCCITKELTFPMKPARNWENQDRHGMVERARCDESIVRFSSPSNLFFPQSLTYPNHKQTQGSRTQVRCGAMSCPSQRSILLYSD